MFQSIIDWFIRLFASKAPAPLPAPTPIKPLPQPPPASLPTEITGIDTSHWEAGVDWPTVAKSTQFAFTKTTEGTGNIDPSFAKYWAAMKAAGLLRGAYHFFHPSMSVQAQAAHFEAVCGPLGHGDFGPILDWEAHDGESRLAEISAAQEFLDDIEKHFGKTPIIYGSYSYLKDLNLPASFAKYPLFVAEYGVSKAKVPPPWSDWTFWQCSEKARVVGVPNPVDFNFFSGSLDDLKKLAQ